MYEYVNTKVEDVDLGLADDLFAAEGDEFGDIEAFLKTTDERNLQNKIALALQAKGVANPLAASTRQAPAADQVDETEAGADQEVTGAL